jgi:hypothetical protein
MSANRDSEETTDDATQERPDGASVEEPAQEGGAGGGAPGEDRQSRRDERWRERATAAEQEVTALRAQVRASRWREVEAVAAPRIADVADLRLVVSDDTLAALFDQDGGLDVDAVHRLLDDVVAEHPAWRAVGHHGDLSPKRGVPPRRTATWAGVIGGR